MNCEQFEDVMAELARDQVMDADLRHAALNHSDDCVRCSQRLRAEQALTRGLSLLSEQMGTMTASSEIEMRLREAFVAQPAGATVSRRRGYWLPVAAAVLVIVGTIIALNWQSQSQGSTDVVEKPAVTPEPQEREQVNKPQAVANNDNNKREVVKPVKPRSRSTRPQPRTETEVVANHAEEIATDFILLGNINSANLQDGGYIVRVEVPRSALVRFGLPVNMERFNENVKADVWLGVDGLAHAIRFVQ